MLKPGKIVLLKQGCKLVRALVIDIDATFVTLKLNYKQSVGTTVKVNVNSKDIIDLEFKSKSTKTMNTEAFDSSNSNFMA